MGTNQSTLLISMDGQAIANEINAIGPAFADYASTALRNGLTGDVVEALLKQDQISAIFEMLGVDNVVHKTSLQLRFDKLIRGEIEPSVDSTYSHPVSTASLAVSTINVTANPIVIADAYSADPQDRENNFPRTGNRMSPPYSIEFQPYISDSSDSPQKPNVTSPDMDADGASNLASASDLNSEYLSQLEGRSMVRDPLLSLSVRGDRMDFASMLQKFQYPSHLSLFQRAFLFLNIIIYFVANGVSMSFLVNMVFYDSSGSLKPFKGGCFDIDSMEQYVCFFSAGQKAVGIIALGQFAVGFITIGQVGIGLLFFLGQCGGGFLLSIAQCAFGAVVPASQIGFALFRIGMCMGGLQSLICFFDRSARATKAMSM